MRSGTRRTRCRRVRALPRPNASGTEGVPSGTAEVGEKLRFRDPRCGTAPGPSSRCHEALLTATAPPYSRSDLPNQLVIRTPEGLFYINFNTYLIVIYCFFEFCFKRTSPPTDTVSGVHPGPSGRSHPRIAYLLRGLAPTPWRPLELSGRGVEAWTDRSGRSLEPSVGPPALRTGAPSPGTWLER